MWCGSHDALPHLALFTWLWVDVPRRDVVMVMVVTAQHSRQRLAPFDRMLQMFLHTKNGQVVTMWSTRCVAIMTASERTTVVLNGYHLVSSAAVVLYIDAAIPHLGTQQHVHV